MTGSPNTTTVNTLTAEVRVLMVGSRQVTLSVYGQLDYIPDTRITPMGRVAPKDARQDWVYIVGKDNETGALARSSLPSFTPEIKTWVASRSQASHWRYEADTAARNAAQCDSDAADLDETAAKLLTGSDFSSVKAGDNYIHTAPYATKQAAKYASEADAAVAASLAAQTDVERLKAIADEARARYNAEDSLQDAQKATAIADQLGNSAAGLRLKADGWRNRAQRATAAAETSDKNDNLERERVAEVSAEWSVLPLIVLAGLR
jgi:hypothetical protein